MCEAIFCQYSSLTLLYICLIGDWFNDCVIFLETYNGVESQKLILVIVDIKINLSPRGNQMCSQLVCRHVVIGGYEEAAENRGT